MDLSARHPATQQLMRWFSYDHLPEGRLRNVSAHCAVMAKQLVDTLRDGPELIAGLRKLLEAKDCFVRQSVADGEAAGCDG